MNRKLFAGPPAIGRSLEARGWVQTDKKAHEVWARFTLRKPTASALLHFMCSHIGDQNAIVVSQTALAKLMGVSERTVRTAIGDLAADRWIQVVRIGKGRECAYVVNDRVAWNQSRSKLTLSLFTASVVADADDQVELEGPELRRIPVLFPGERQLPTGPGENPPSQPMLEGTEPDLPSIRQTDNVDPRALQRGQARVDAESGEILPSNES